MLLQLARGTPDGTHLALMQLGVVRSLANPLTGGIITQMPTPAIKDMLDLAVRLATESTSIALSRFGHTTTTLKADDSVVTEADHMVQDHILGGIAGAYPDHAVCAEETLSQSHRFPGRTDAQYCWVIDPIDGTRNYASGLPSFSTSIGVLDRGRPIAGVVYEHNVRLLFTAGLGMGASRNGTPVHVEEVPKGCDVLLGIPSSKDRMSVNILRDWVAEPGLVCRNFGSTALHLAYVASGALGAVFCKRAKIWDIAAGVLIVTEAGGRITDAQGVDRTSFDLSLDSNEDLPFLAAAPLVHDRLLESIRQHTSDGRA